MERPRIFVVNDPDIARVLRAERDLSVKHITRRNDWWEAQRHGYVIVMNRAGPFRNERHDLNPIASLAHYHRLVERVLYKGMPPPQRAWQPATLIDCRTEQPDFTLTSMCNSIARQFINMLHWKWKRELEIADTLKDCFSCTLRLNQLVGVVRENYRRKLAQEELAWGNRDAIAYYDHEPYVEHLM